MLFHFDGADINNLKKNSWKGYLFPKGGKQDLSDPYNPCNDNCVSIKFAFAV